MAPTKRIVSPAAKPPKPTGTNAMPAPYGAGLDDSGLGAVIQQLLQGGLITEPPALPAQPYMPSLIPPGTAEGNPNDTLVADANGNALPQNTMQGQPGIDASTRSTTTGTSGVNLATTFNDPSAPVESPHLLNPEYFVGNFPMRGAQTAAIPKYGEGATGDNRNFLLGLSLLPWLGGGNLPAALGSYVDAGTKGLDRNNERRYTEGVNLFNQDAKNVDQKYADAIASYSAGASANKEKNANISDFNTNLLKQYGINTTANSSAAATTQRERAARVKSITDQLKPYLSIISDQRQKDVDPAGVKSATDYVNKVLSDLHASGYATADVMPYVYANQTLSQAEQKALDQRWSTDVMHEVETTNRTQMLVDAGLTKNQQDNATQSQLQAARIAANAKQEAADRQQRYDIAANSQWLTLHGMELGASEAENKRNFEQWKTRNGFGEGSANNTAVTKLNTNLLESKAEFDKITRDITGFNWNAKDATKEELTKQFRLLDNNRDNAYWRMKHFQTQLDNALAGKPYTFQAPLPQQNAPEPPKTAPAVPAGITPQKPSSGSTTSTYTRGGGSGTTTGRVTNFTPPPASFKTPPNTNPSARNVPPPRPTRATPPVRNGATANAMHTGSLTPAKATSAGAQAKKAPPAKATATLMKTGSSKPQKPRKPTTPGSYKTRSGTTYTVEYN